MLLGKYTQDLNISIQISKFNVRCLKTQMQIDITTRYSVVVYLVLNRTQNQVVWKDTEIRSYRENNAS